MLTRDIDLMFFGLNGSIQKLIQNMWRQSYPHEPVAYASGYPPVNYKVDKNNGNAIIQYALAGFKKQDVKVKVVNNTLQISVNKVDKSETSVDVIHNGIASRSINQKFACAEQYCAEKANVSFEDGILRIQIPKVRQNVKLLTIN